MSLRLSFALALVVIAGCSSSTQPSDAAAANDAGSAHDAASSIDAAPDAALVDAGRPIDATGSDAAMLDTASTNDAFTADAATTDAAPTDAGGSLTTCGGFGGATCMISEYCQYTGPVACGAADGTGVCRARPSSCAPDTTAVCGCDARDYASACEANRAGTDVASIGHCNGTRTFPCGPTDQCVAGAQYCEIVEGGPPPGSTSYSCNMLPASCLAMTSTPSCATCFPGSTVGDMCMDVGTGEMTVTLLTP
jgi:hypothetical protein